MFNQYSFKRFIFIQTVFGLSIVALILGENAFGYEVSLMNQVKPNSESFYLVVVTIGMFLGRPSRNPCLIVRLRHRLTIFWQNFFNMLAYVLTSSMIYWTVVGFNMPNVVLPSLLIDAFLFMLNGCLIGSILFMLDYILADNNTLPLLICLAIIFVVCFARMFASPHLNNGYNLFIAQSWFKGNFAYKTIACVLIIFSLNYFNTELTQKIEVY